MVNLPCLMVLRTNFLRPTYSYTDSSTLRSLPPKSCPDPRLPYGRHFQFVYILCKNVSFCMHFLPLTLPLFFSCLNGIIQGKLCRNLSAERVLRLYLCKNKHQLHSIVPRKTALRREQGQDRFAPAAAPRKIVPPGEPL